MTNNNTSRKDRVVKRLKSAVIAILLFGGLVLANVASYATSSPLPLIAWLVTFAGFAIPVFSGDLVHFSIVKANTAYLESENERLRLRLARLDNEN